MAEVTLAGLPIPSAAIDAVHQRLMAAPSGQLLIGVRELAQDLAAAALAGVPARHGDLLAIQDRVLLAIENRRPVEDSVLRTLPPWRAVLLGTVAHAAGRYERQALDELMADAVAVGGAGQLPNPGFEEDSARRWPRNQEARP